MKGQIFKKRSLVNALAGFSVLICANAASAAFVEPTDWQRGAQGSAYLEWDNFDGATSTRPDVGSRHIQSSVLSETLGQAFRASSGNMYSFSGPQSYTLSVETGANGPSILSQQIDVMLQISTWNFRVEDNLVALNGQAGSVTEILAGQTNDPVWGDIRRYEYLFEWTLSASTSVYDFSWDLDQTHTSLDAIALDIFGSGSSVGDTSIPTYFPSLPVIPGSAIFNGSPIAVAGYIDIDTSGVVASDQQVAPVPLPASVYLMMAALGVLFRLGRSKRG